jgi:serine/threonine protein kinase
MGKKFQSPNYIYYIHEEIKGRDFSDILKEMGLITNEDAQFYTANIILILEYFWKKSIVSRDIKP